MQYLCNDKNGAPKMRLSYRFVSGFSVNRDNLLITVYLSGGQNIEMRHDDVPGFEKTIATLTEGMNAQDQES